VPPAAGHSHPQHDSGTVRKGRSIAVKRARGTILGEGEKNSQMTAKELACARQDHVFAFHPAKDDVPSGPRTATTVRTAGASVSRMAIPTRLGCSDQDGASDAYVTPRHD